MIDHDATPDEPRQQTADPIEVSPDDTIINGHHRFLPAQLLGFPEIAVVVREID
jgi:ParB-like chromosome segregation protein Spo0J